MKGESEMYGGHGKVKGEGRKGDGKTCAYQDLIKITTNETKAVFVLISFIINSPLAIFVPCGWYL